MLSLPARYACVSTPLWVVPVKATGIPVILKDRSVDANDPSLFGTFIGADFVEDDAAPLRGLWCHRVGTQSSLSRKEREAQHQDDLTSGFDRDETGQLFAML